MRKPGKHGVRSGNTFHFGCLPALYKRCGKNEEMVVKTVLSCNIIEQEKHQQMAKLYSDIFDDGNLSHMIRFGPPVRWPLSTVEMTLNKHKRWLLPELLLVAIDEIAAEEEKREDGIECRLTFTEKSWCSLSASGPLSDTVRDCIGYHDSGARLRHVKPRQPYGRASVLQMRARDDGGSRAEKLSKARIQRRQVKRNHTRGAQRHVKKLSWMQVEKEIRDSARIEQEKKALEPKAEIQYEIRHRRPLMAHRDYSYKGHYRKYSWKYLFSHPQKSIKKIKPSILKNSSLPGICKNHRRYLSFQCTERDYDFSLIHGQDLPINSTQMFESAEFDADWSDSNNLEELSEDDASSRRGNCSYALAEFFTESIKSQKMLKADRKLSKLKDSLETATREQNTRLGKGQLVYMERSQESISVNQSITQKQMELDNENLESSFTVINKPSEFVLPADVCDNRIYIPVMLDKMSVLPESLKKSYGNQYKDGECVPRKFTINISAKFEGEVKGWGSRNITLLFEEFGANNIAKAGKNSFSEYRFSFADFDWIESEIEKLNFSDLKESIHIQTVTGVVLQGVSEAIRKSIRNSCGKESQSMAKDVVNMNSKLEPLSFIRDVVEPLRTIQSYERNAALNLINHAVLKTREEANNSVDTAQALQKNQVAITAEYCEICWTNLQDSSGLSLRGCGHYFCLQCWQHYLIQLISQRSLRLKCPGHSCELYITRVVLAAVLPRHYLKKYDEYQAEAEIEKNRNEWSFCSNSKCTRITNISTSSKRYNVHTSCICGSRWCVNCRTEPHWPSTCKQAATYYSMLIRRGDAARHMLDRIEVLRIKYKACPRCNYPIEKHGGCDHMHCTRCNADFCWLCKVFISEHGGATCRSTQDYDVVEFGPEDFGSSEVHYMKAVLQRMKRYQWNYNRMRRAVLQKFKQFLRYTVPDRGILRRGQSIYSRMNYDQHINTLMSAMTQSHDSLESNDQHVISQLASVLWKAAILYIDARYMLEYSNAKVLALGLQAGSANRARKLIDREIFSFTCFADHLESDLLGLWSTEKNIERYVEDLKARCERGKLHIQQMYAICRKFDLTFAKESIQNSQ